MLLLLMLFVPAILFAETRVSTASSGTHVMPAIEMPGMNRQRIIRVYLPPGYQIGKRRYPVLYMHDAQNLFDEATSYAGEWGVDETLDQLAKSRGLEIIVIGIDNGQEKRLNELSPWTNKRFGIAEGKLYLDFIVNTLKPSIDRDYRTLPDRENTAIMGSSMGGLMSHYAIHRYPAVFSKAGIFSPSYWYSKNIFTHTKAKPTPASAKLYLISGSREGEEAIRDLEKMGKLLRAQKHPEKNLHLAVVTDGEHNEKFWRTEFPNAVTWLFENNP